MAEDIYNIEKWKTEYPFLQRIWKSYEDFDKSVDKDENEKAYKMLCDLIREPQKIEEGMYNDFCKKIVKNLGPFSYKPESERLSSESCQFLYQWVYYMKMKYNIPDNFTKEIFDRSNTIISVSNEKHVCPYYSYEEKIKEPPNIIKIFNLQIVMDDLVSILMEDNHQNNCSCRKFISECTKIYKDMNSTYCSDENKEDPKNADTCSQLSTFKTFYELFISLNQDLKSKLPSLSDSNMNDIIPCDSEKTKEELTSTTSEVHKSDSSIKIDTNAVLGTMTGVSSLFALSYKFTPLGKWFRPRHLRGTLASNNIGKQEEYELFHNGLENENISFDQTKYNVAYSPV